MKFNFEKHIKNPVKKVILGGAIIASSMKPGESKAQTPTDSIEKIKDTSLNLNTQEKINSKNDSIEFYNKEKINQDCLKQGAEEDFKQLESFKLGIQNFSEKEVGILIDYMCQDYRKNSSKKEVTTQEFLKHPIERYFDGEMTMLQGDLAPFFAKVLDAIPDGKSYKEKFNKAVDEYIRLVRLNNVSFQGDKAIDKDIQEKWEAKNSPENK